MGYGWWWCSLGAVMSMLVWKGVDATVCIIATRNYSRKGRNWKMFCRALVMFDYNVLRDVTAALFCVKHWKSCTLWEWINYWRHTHTQLPATWCDYNDRDDVSEFENVFSLSLWLEKKSWKYSLASYSRSVFSFQWGEWMSCCFLSNRWSLPPPPSDDCGIK